MKLTLTFFALMAAASTMAYPTREFPTFGKGPLYDDLREFVDLLPYDEMVNVLLDYYYHDRQAQDFANFLAEENGFKDLFGDIEAIDEVRQFMNYLHFNGIYVYEFVNDWNRRIGLGRLEPPMQPANFDMFRQYNGVFGMIAELQNLVPVDKLNSLHAEKMQTSAAYRDLVAQVSSPYCRRIPEKIAATPGYKRLMEKLNEYRNEPSDYSYYSALEDDFQDFIKLIPMNKVIEIVTLYLAEDEEVQKALAFAQSKDFHDLVRLVENLEEYQELVKYLTAAGLDVASYIQKLHKFIGMEDYVPPTNFVSVQTTNGLKGMIEEIKAVLPLDKLKALYEEKLKTSKAFADFIAHLSSPKMQHIVDTLFKNPTFLDVLKKAKEAGLDIVAVSKLLNEMLGLHFPNN